MKFGKFTGSQVYAFTRWFAAGPFAVKLPSFPYWTGIKKAPSWLFQVIKTLPDE
jgi:hypothetical protein